MVEKAQSNQKKTRSHVLDPLARIMNTDEAVAIINARAALEEEVQEAKQINLALKSECLLVVQEFPEHVSITSAAAAEGTRWLARY